MPREKMAGVEGVEPSHTAPETAVLPLDDTPTELSRHTARKRRAQVSMLRKQAPPVKPQFWELRKMRGAARRRRDATTRRRPDSRLGRAPIALPSPPSAAAASAAAKSIYVISFP